MFITGEGLYVKGEFDVPSWIFNNARQYMNRAMLDEQIAILRVAMHTQNASFVRYRNCFETHGKEERERVPQSSLTDPLRSPKNTIVSC